MKHTFKYLIVLAIASTIISCSNSGKENATDNTTKRYNEIEKANWLIGQWQNNSPEGNATEVWDKLNDSTFIGKSYFVVGKDTVSSETIRLEQNGSELFYIPTVKEQNAGQPVKFTLTNSSNNQLVFENSKHDFPQKISYTKISKDSLLAEISGIMEGKQNSQNFPMTKIK